MRSHSLEQSNKDSSGNCNPYASSPVVIPNVDSGDRVNGECPSPAPAVPPSGYVLAGQMNLGAINVPALNSANLSELDEWSNVPLPNFLLHVPFSTHLRFVLCSLARSPVFFKTRNNHIWPPSSPPVMHDL